MKSTLYFLLGAGIGATAGFLVGKYFTEKKLHEECDKEIEDMRRYYEEKIGAENIAKDYAACQSEEKPNEDVKEETPIKTYDGFVNYRDYFDPAESEHPDDEDVEKTLPNESDEMDEFHRKNKNRQPRIISEEASGDLPPGVDHKILYFYEYDESLVDPEINEEIDEPGYLVGDCLEKYDFIDSEERIIFVLNYELDTLYEIEKVKSSFREEYD